MSSKFTFSLLSAAVIAVVSFFLGYFAGGKATHSDFGREETSGAADHVADSADSASSSALDSLAALGYVDATYDPKSHLRDVVDADYEQVFPGFNFYNSRKGKSAHLVSMTGQVVHTWALETPENWQSSTLLPNGDVIALQKDLELVRLDLRSQIEWRLKGGFHHDLDVYRGEIYAVERLAEVHPAIHPHRKVLTDYISIITPDGKERHRFSLLEVLLSSPFAYLLPSLSPGSSASDGPLLDILHTNHIEVFDGQFGEHNPLFRAGNLLLSTRSLNAIFILDGETHDVLWLWGPGNLTEQHHPRLIDNGNILVFDNGIETSRVLELDPIDRTIVWSYKEEGFYSRRRGSVQRLPNGNTLITESDKGYVLEVTSKGEVVWKFANPDVDNEGKRAAIWRMTRFAAADLRFLPTDLDPIG
jgi:hypothetical protein